MKSKNAHRPHTKRLMELLRLDNQVLSGNGNKLNLRTPEGKNIEALDLVSGYGSCLLGHNTGFHQKYASRESENHGFAQLVDHQAAEVLATKLRNLVHSEVGIQGNCIFGNSGAEAVEIALIHAELQYEARLASLLEKGTNVFSRLVHASSDTQRSDLLSVCENWKNETREKLFGISPTLVLMKGAYHGKTIGTRIKSTWGSYNTVFVQPNSDARIHAPIVELRFPTLSSGDLNWKNVEVSTILAIMAEPVLGEGGVYPLQPEFLHALRDLANTYSCPLILDEIQSGSFRHGSLLCSSNVGVKADIYCLGKALGAGIAKISVAIIDENIYDPEIENKFVSTYSSDDWSCEVAIDYLGQQTLIQKRKREVEPRMFECLTKLKQQYPEVISEIRGSSYLWAIEFNSLDTSGSYTLQAISRSGMMNYMFASFLLHQGGIRCSAPLSNNKVLRFHLDVHFDEYDAESLFSSFSLLCSAIENQDAYFLVRHLLTPRLQELRDHVHVTPHRLESIEYTPSDDVPTIAFITHYISINTILLADPSFDGCYLPDLEEFLETYFELLPPIINGSRIIETGTGKRVKVLILGLPYTSQMALNALKSRRLEKYRNSIKKAVEWAESLNCTAIGLGQYNSILTGNGKAIGLTHATLTTGNGLTVYLAAKRLLQTAEARNVDLTLFDVAIIGGTGNIGSALVDIIEPHVKSTVVFGNPESEKKHPNVCYDPQELKKFKLVLVATNSTAEFLTDENVRKDVILVDISVPSNISNELRFTPGNRELIEGGLAYLPDEKGIPSKGIPLPPHAIYGCLTETILLGLYDKPSLQSIGGIDAQNSIALGALAEHEGFEALSPKNAKPLSHYFDFSHDPSTKA